MWVKRIDDRLRSCVGVVLLVLPLRPRVDLSARMGLPVAVYQTKSRWRRQTVALEDVVEVRRCGGRGRREIAK